MLTRLSEAHLGLSWLTIAEGTGAGGPLACAVFSLVIATFGSLSAAALLLHSPSKLVRRRRSGQRIDDLQQHTREFQLTACVIALGGIVATMMFADSAAAGSLLAPLLFGVATLFLCGALAVAFAEKRAESLVLGTLPLLRILHKLLRYPLVVPLLVWTRWTLHLLRIPEKPLVDPDEIAGEIMAAVTDSANKNALQDKEKSWIENIVELKSLHVSAAMTPRTDVIALEAKMELEEAIAQAVSSGYSRYPVYEGEVDNVVGVFYAKDALARLGNGGCRETKVRDLMRTPLFVPGSMGVVELLEQFKASKVQMAIVLDEYGGTAGLISIEDILEEIVGDISDEYDPEEEAPIKVIEQGRVLEISGKARVDEVNEDLGIAIPEGADYDTVAGYVFCTLGRIPKIGEAHVVGGVEFCVLRADARRIDRIRITVHQPERAGSGA